MKHDERGPAKSRYRVPFDGGFRVDRAPTAPPKKAPGKKQAKERLAELVERLAELQRLLYADDHHTLLVVFQALDAAGKDSTIRNVFSGVDPAGFQVFSFKAPSAEELDHDFLWRTAARLPERGRIGVFNRSYYEEVLVVRVHPEHLVRQRLPGGPDRKRIWEERFESIRDHERHLARNGVAIVKIWLHVSAEEQRRRFLARLDEPEKNWKFALGDVEERRHRAAYLAAYEEALNATSRAEAPWYAIPADDKAYARLQVAEILVETLERLGLRWPTVAAADRERFEEMRRALVDDGS